jgi:UDP-glucose:glycoprotein glucosyltransferase
MKFAQDILESHDPETLSSKIKSLYNNIYDNAKTYPGFEKRTYNDLVNGHDDVVSHINTWTSRLGVSPSDSVIFANGQVVANDDNWINKVATFLRDDVITIQKAVYSADITDQDDFHEYFLQNASKRRNGYIFPTQAGDIEFINLGQVNIDEMVYLPGSKGTTIMWIIDDFDSERGVELVKAAVLYQGKYPLVTIGLVHNPGEMTGEPNLSLLVYHLTKMGLLSDDAGVEKFRQLVQEVDFASTLERPDDIERISGVKASSWRTIDSEEARKFWEKGFHFVDMAGFGPGERGIIVNGRVCLCVLR